MKKTAAKGTIEIPKEIWETAETKGDLEDWLLSHDARASNSFAAYGAKKT